jgi:hypothetical protein
MLPARCSRLPCMNIAVKIVSHHTAWPLLMSRSHAIRSTF